MKKIIVRALKDIFLSLTVVIMYLVMYELDILLLPGLVLVPLIGTIIFRLINKDARCYDTGIFLVLTFFLTLAMNMWFNTSYSGGEEAFGYLLQGVLEVLSLSLFLLFFPVSHRILRGRRTDNTRNVSSYVQIIVVLVLIAIDVSGLKVFHDGIWNMVNCSFSGEYESYDGATLSFDMYTLEYNDSVTASFRLKDGVFVIDEESIETEDGCDPSGEMTEQIREAARKNTLTLNCDTREIYLDYEEFNSKG